MTIGSENLCYGAFKSENALAANQDFATFDLISQKAKRLGQVIDLGFRVRAKVVWIQLECLKGDNQLVRGGLSLTFRR
ncbi:hypothetical protein D3C84_1007400 [compost metagenome]